MIRVSGQSIFKLYQDLKKPLLKFNEYIKENFGSCSWLMKGEINNPASVGNMASKMAVVAALPYQ